ncbi:MAG: hypothetical protein AAGD38_10520 [Acidobacteriota bacterium]
MSDALFRRIELTLEEGRLGDARALLSQAPAGPERDRWAKRYNELVAIATEANDERLANEVEAVLVGDQPSSSIGAEPRTLVTHAQRALHRADYERALEYFRRAVELAPHDTSIRQQFDQTEKAARRHRAAVARNQAATEAAGRIAAAIDAERLDEARELLRRAGEAHGKHSALTAQQERLASRLRDADRHRAEDRVSQARQLLDDGQVDTALQTLDEARRLDPQHPALDELGQRARQLRAEEESRRARADLIDETVVAIERMIEAGASRQAATRLQGAIAKIGREPRLLELASRIDAATVDRQAKARLEWAERRANEAAALARAADGAMLRAEYADAVTKLEQARELDPQVAIYGSKLEAAQQALAKQETEQRRIAARNQHIALIRARLEALRLVEAEALIARAETDFGEHADFAALRARLERLRDTGDGEIATRPTNPESALERQRASASAYSWQQRLLFPIRGGALALFLGLAGGAIGLDLLGSVDALDGVLWIARLLLPVIALLILVPAIVRETASGENVFTVDPKRLAPDAALMISIVVLTGWPLVVWLSGASWHGAFTPDAGFAGWLLTSALVIATLIAVATLLAATTFGIRQLPRLGRHVGLLSSAQPDLATAVHIGFILVLAIIAVRVWLVPITPFLGYPVAAVLEAYTLLVTAHLIGLAVRHHRIELGALYR